MRYRGVRIGLLLVFVAALGSAGYRVFELERRIAAEAERAREFDALSWTLAAGILELRAAQQAYVSVGQGESYWIDRVSSRIGTLRSSLTALERVARAPEATDAASAAGSSLQSFEQMDATVRDYVAKSQRLMASDLIYTDGIQLTAVVGSHVEASRYSDRASSDGLTRAARVQQVSFAAGAGVIGLIITALLVSPVRAKERAREGSSRRARARIRITRRLRLDRVGGERYGYRYGTAAGRRARLFLGDARAARSDPSR